MANILFLESPAGTGFSYTNTESDLENPGDMKTAADNYVFLVKWLERFPEYKGREFYIAGESYAGHYVPQLAQTILAHNNNKTFINLRGILIGNPSLDDEAEAMGMYEFLLSHGVISQEFFLSLEKSCRGDPPNPTECMDLNMKVEDAVGQLNRYDILAPKCLNATLMTNQSKECITVMQSDPCREHYMAAYFNLPEVQRSMHVTKLPYTWKLCNIELGGTWNQMESSASMIPILKELMSHEHLRVWVFSGDTDTVIPVTGTLKALKPMNLTVVKEWLAWFSEGQVGGYTEEYRGNFRFATVRGAGHEVPLYKPKPALTLFKQFILNSPLPLTP